MTTSSYESLSHSRWDCKYHVVFIPKCRKKELYGKIRKFLGPLFHELAGQRGSKITEGHMVQDHVHMLIKIPPKHSVSEVIGYIKGKSAIAVARQYGGRKRLMVSDFGLVVIAFQRLVLKKIKLELTSRIKNNPIAKVLMNSDSFTD